MKIASIIIKDLKILLSDKKALAIMILMPIILTTILSMALKGSFATGNDVKLEQVNIAVVKKYEREKDAAMFEANLNNSLLSNGMGEDAIKNLIDSSDEVDPEEIFFKEFLETDDVSEFISYRVEDEATAIELLKNEKVSAIVILPDKFIYNMKINMLTPFRNKINIEVLTHPDRSIDGKIVNLVIDAYTNTMSSIIIGKNVIIESAMANGIGDDGFSDMDELIEGMNDVLESVKINISDVVLEGKSPISSSDYYSVAMTTMFILFAAGQGGRMLLEEKDNQTYQRMVVAGTTKFQVLSGKLIAVFLIAVFQITVMILFTHFALKVQWGNFTSVALISVAAAFAVAGLGSFIGALTFVAGNYKMANIFENIIIQGMAVLGGSFFPLDIMPKFIQNFSFSSLNGVALKAYLKVLSGSNTSDVLSYIMMLAVFGVVFTILAVMVLKSKEGKTYAKHNKTKIAKA